MQELYARLNDDPDLLHADYTPSVHDLIRAGRPALPRALDLMQSDDRATRVRAQRVLEGVTLREYGFVQGEGWKPPDGEAEWRWFWARLGDLRYDGPRTRGRPAWRSSGRGWPPRGPRSPAGSVAAVYEPSEVKPPLI